MKIKLIKIAALALIAAAITACAALPEEEQAWLIMPEGIGERRGTAGMPAAGSLTVAYNANMGYFMEDAPQTAYEVSPRYAETMAINQDVIGWIKIPGTRIDYPVFYSGENDRYLDHDMYGKKSSKGSIFMDMHNSGALLDKNTYIHGHNMKDGSMFADLIKYKNKAFFESHKTIEFSNLYSDMVWEVFAVYVVPADNHFIRVMFLSDSDFLRWVGRIGEAALIKTDYKPTKDDYILTLNTCSNEYANAHTIVHAYLVSKTDHLREKGEG